MQGKVDGELLLIVTEENLVLMTAKHVKEKESGSFNEKCIYQKHISIKETFI